MESLAELLVEPLVNAAEVEAVLARERCRARRLGDVVEADRAVHFWIAGERRVQALPGLIHSILSTHRRTMPPLRAEAVPFVPLNARQQENNRKEMNNLLREINMRRRRNLNPKANQNEMTNLLREINNMRAHNLRQDGGRTRKQKRRSQKKSRRMHRA